MEKVSKCIFRFQCLREFCQKRLFNKLLSGIGILPDIVPDKLCKALKKEKCCNSCKHNCTTCKEECITGPDCANLPCDACGTPQKYCNFQEMQRAAHILIALSKITEEDCTGFLVKYKEIKMFRKCKKMDQLFYFLL